MAVDFDDFEYAIPGESLSTLNEHRRVRVDYDLRTGPELAAARMDDHQRRIGELEMRLRHVERLLHMVVNRNAEQSADGM